MQCLSVCLSVCLCVTFVQLQPNPVRTKSNCPIRTRASERATHSAWVSEPYTGNLSFIGVACIRVFTAIEAFYVSFQDQQRIDVSRAAVDLYLRGRCCASAAIIICCHAVCVCLSVFVCVWPSRSYILSKRINISSKFFHHRVATPF